MANSTESDGVDFDAFRLVLQDSRAKILQQILAAEPEALSVPELAYRNPSLKQTTVVYHLRELVDAGVVERRKLPKGERHRDLPSTFYAVTGKGESLLERTGLRAEIGTWREVYAKMDRTPEIAEIEAMERPSRAR